MKRILKAGILATAFSVFFTGCGSSSLVSGVKGGYQEATWAVKETESEKDKEMRNMPESDMPNAYEINEEEKKEKPQGIAAFKIADGHSDNTKDIEMFEIGNLLSDGTFLYCYTTKVGTLAADAEVDNRQIVHCAAAYNYKTQQFKTFHTKTFNRVNEDSESFYMQLCSSSGDGDIFIYDNGVGYLYGADGTEKFKEDIETFVRKHFKGYSVVATEALTDGNDRIYVDLAIEKTEISAAPDPDDSSNNKKTDDNTTDEEADKEAEALDKEFADKMIETVLVYDLKDYTGSIDQENLKMQDQIDRWKSMRDISSGYLGWTPVAEDDWGGVVKDIPSEWGPSFLYHLPNWSKDQLKEVGITETKMTGTPLFQWNGDPVFQYQSDGCIPTFEPETGKYRLHTELEGNMDLNNVFVKIDGRYYALSGKTKDDLGEGDYENVTFARTVKRVDYLTETITDPETNETTEKTTNVISYHTQSLTKKRKRDTYVSNGKLKGYWTLNKGGIVSVFDVADGTVFCLTREGSGDSAEESLAILNRDGSVNSLANVTGYAFIDIYKQNDQYYANLAGNGFTLIVPLNIDSKVINILGLQHVLTAHLNDPIKQVFNLETEVDPKYHEAYDGMVSDDKGNVMGEESGEHLDGNNMLQVKLENIQEEKLSLIKAYKDAEAELFSDEQKQILNEYNQSLGRNIVYTTGNGYLICTMSHGLVYFDHGSKYAYSLDEGTWYGIWNQGDKIVAVGFGNDGTTYDAIDKAHACVAEFDMDELYENGLSGIVSSMYAVLENEREETLSEDQKTLLKQWNEKNEDRKVTFITPENGEDVYDAWKDSVPGELTKDRTEGTEGTEAGGENSQDGQETQETPKE